MKETKVYMGSLPSSWGEGKKIKTITFSITDECNLRCTYCYFAHKTHKNVMSFSTAKKAVDDILEESLYDIYEGVVWEFIGGEPTIEMDLVDKISDYIVCQMYRMNHKWLYCYRFMMSTNGLLYDSKSVQKYIEKHQMNLYMAITIDGSKEKHNLSRIKKDGSGSYDDVAKMIPLWQKQFNGIMTKATFAHDDLPYLKDSIINLWNLGLKSVSANIVFENVWSEEDPKIYKQQLFELADYIIENDLWDEYSVRFFDPIVGTPYTEHGLRLNTCGSGRMLAINTSGDYFPCIRFMPSATNNHRFKKLGDVNTKINSDRMRPFYVLNTINQSSQKCLDCDVPGGCAWCTGLNFDDSSIGTIFERQTHLCEMHKANVAANKYLWRNYELAKHKISPYRYKKLTSISPNNKYMYVICNSEFQSFCEYQNGSNTVRSVMSDSMLEKTIQYCEDNNFVPILCGCNNLPSDYYAYRMVSFSEYRDSEYVHNTNYLTQLVASVSELDEDNNIDLQNIITIILTYKASQLDKLFGLITKLSNKNKNLNLCIVMNELDISAEDYLAEYKKFLDKLLILTINSWQNNNYLMVNVLVNELFANVSRSCGAGKNSYTVSPEGKVYLCAGFYHNDPTSTVGDVENGIDNIYSKYCDMDNAPLCQNCEVKHCSRCIFRNKFGTGEYHIPTELQCVVSHMEYAHTYALSKALNDGIVSFPKDYNTKLKEVEHYDPMFLLNGNEHPKHGYDLYVQRLEQDMNNNVKL